MAASSSAPSERFGRLKERLEERREEGEEDLTEEDAEPFLLNAEVMTCIAPDAGRLLLPPATSSLTGETGGTEPVPLSLWPKIEDRLRW